MEVSRLRKVYAGGHEAVRSIDFEVAPGEVFGLLGPNGAGKSTTIGMLTTTIRPTSGTARLAGHDVATDPIRSRRSSAVVFQEPVVDRGLTGRRNLEIHGRLWGLDRVTVAARIGDVAERFALGRLLDRTVETYSGGERRRLEIARALLSQPQVLFLDEPTVGLDPRIRFELLDVIAALRERAMTIVLTTHYLDEAERLCDRVAIMHEGGIVALDTPKSLLAQLGDEIIELRVHDDASASLSLLRARGLADDDAFVVGSTITVPLRDHTVARAVDAIEELGIVTAAITTRMPTLDDVYLRLTGTRLAA